MKKIATKALATLLIVTVLTISMHTNVAAAPVSAEKRDEKLEKLQQHHDRKFELRASVLGISSEQLKEELKERNFDQIIKKRGFKDRGSFHVAMVGKLKEELLKRGVSEQKIENMIQKRAERLAL